MSRMGSGLRKSLVLVGVFALVVPLLLALATPVLAATLRVNNGVACSDVTGNPYCTIQAAVNAAHGGDVIHVYPGTYNEGVDLNQMNPQGDITLITVDANGNPTPGTVTVDNPGDDAEIYTGNGLIPFNGDVTIDGFVLRSEYGAIDLWLSSGGQSPEGAGAGLGPADTLDVEIRNVDASHTGGDGITVRAEGSVTIKDCTTNDNQGYGIGVLRAWGDVTITGCTSNENKGPAVSLGGTIACQAGGICVGGAQGQITIRNSTANGNGSDGILVGPVYLEGQEAGVGPVPEELIIDRCTANNNDWDGISVVSGFGDTTITDCTTNGNGDDGVHVGGRFYGDELGPPPVVIIDGGDVLIQNCTSNGNGASGFDPEVIGGTVSIQACIARDNDEHGVDLDWWRMSEALLVNGSIICGNECGISLVDIQETLESERFSNELPTQMNFEGNWWGCPGGPEAAGCDPICQEDSIAVDFTPWISKISASATVDPVNVGEPTVVSFQFSGNPSAVYLGKGPGDLRGPAPFTVSTDNGRLDGNGSTVHKFLGANGTLKVTLVPERGDTATVTVTGPCGIGELEGAKAVLGVLEEDFVPEPGSVMLLASGLMGLAGYAGLRLRKK